MLYLQLKRLLSLHKLSATYRVDLRRGFTIVELLIIIVIIGILAALVIVSYAGIRNRADSARAHAAANQLTKALRMYYADKGTYPSTSSAPTWEVCLGRPSDFPAEGPFAAGQCLVNPDGYVVSASDTVMNALAPYAQFSNPRLSNAKMGTEDWRGIRYTYVKGSIPAPRVEWVVNGSQSCEPASGTPGGYWGSTWCVLEVTD